MHWKQTSNPVTTTGGGVTGYEAVNVTHTENKWGGLEFNGNECLLDGSIGETEWFYCVGYVCACVPVRVCVSAGVSLWVCVCGVPCASMSTRCERRRQRARPPLTVLLFISRHSYFGSDWGQGQAIPSYQRPAQSVELFAKNPKTNEFQVRSV